MKVEAMIDDLESALDGYLATSPDHLAMLEVRRLKNELRSNPERVVVEICDFFSGPKTVVTDSFQSPASREAASEVESARKPLGNHFAKQRRERGHNG
ncbi:hypothetical protein GCM10007392_34360 [Saccharospirillum salsuginis]|uniref:Uncharacterized protein n=1 Tax=Saccharospirillum salsuginis TaxID=418750 RepID=A0A918KHL8_9GAMM|nr:hypothetical protein GCM10007392_34360 [Saccharospirillum salsuginis]